MQHYLAGGVGSLSGVIVGGAIAQFFAGPDTHGLLWLAALIGAVVSGIVSEVTIRSSLSKSDSTGAVSAMR